MMEPYRVSRLIRLLKELLEGDPRLNDVWVEGEVSDLRYSTAGHAYLTLKDGWAQLRCVMFRHSRTGPPIEAGAQILVHGSLSFYEKGGDLQLVVDFVQKAGIGLGQAQLERLKERLGAEGLFDASRKRLLPRFPRRIGVVTSPTGAVFHDICRVLERRWPLAGMLLAPTVVQGPAAAAGIASSIDLLNVNAVGVDVIIVARGGGTAEELAVFNDEMVARAIYGSRAPVISGIGHETDNTIADLVSDLRAPTPSAAAELAVPDRAQIDQQVAGMIDIIRNWGPSQVACRSLDVQALASRMKWGIPDLPRHRERLDGLLRTVAQAVSRLMVQHGERLEGCSLRLRALDPSNTLARGYAVVQGRDAGRAIISPRQVKDGDKLDVYVLGGHFPVEVSEQHGF